MPGSIKAYTPPTCATALSFKTSRHSWETATTNPYHLISTAFIQRWPMSLQHFKREEWCQDEVLIAHDEWSSNDSTLWLCEKMAILSRLKCLELFNSTSRKFTSKQQVYPILHACCMILLILYSRSEVQILPKDLGYQCSWPSFCQRLEVANLPPPGVLSSPHGWASSHVQEYSEWPYGPKLVYRNDPKNWNLAFIVVLVPPILTQII